LIDYDYCTKKSDSNQFIWIFHPKSMNNFQTKFASRYIFTIVEDHASRLHLIEMFGMVFTVLKNLVIAFEKVK